MMGLVGTPSALTSTTQGLPYWWAERYGLTGPRDKGDHYGTHEGRQRGRPGGEGQSHI